MVRARVRDAISPILRYSTLFAAILGPECLVDFLFKGFLIIGCVPVDVFEKIYAGSNVYLREEAEEALRDPHAGELATSGTIRHRQGKAA